MLLTTELDKLSGTEWQLFFADKDGGDLKIASHHRATAYDDYRREIARILS